MKSHRVYRENELGYYAGQYQVFYAYERVTRGESFGDNPLVNSRLRDAIYDWKKWKEEHPNIQPNEIDSLKTYDPIAPHLDDISLPVAHQFDPSDLAFYAAKYEVSSVYEKLKKGENADEIARNPLFNSRLQDAIFDWEKWKKDHSVDSVKDSSEDLQRPVKSNEKPGLFNNEKRLDSGGSTSIDRSHHVSEHETPTGHCSVQ